MLPVERVLGSVPTTDYTKIILPGLASDLQRVEFARALGLTRRTYPFLTALAFLLVLLLLMSVAGWWWLLRMRLRRHHA